MHWRILFQFGIHTSKGLRRNPIENEDRWSRAYRVITETLTPPPYFHIFPSIIAIAAGLHKTSPKAMKDEESNGDDGFA